MTVVIHSHKINIKNFAGANGGPRTSICELKPHAKYRTLGQLLLGEKQHMKKTEERREKNAVNRGHFVLPKTPKSSARKSVGPALTKERTIFYIDTKHSI